MVEVPEKAKLAFACAGIFFSFSYFAVLQEDVYKKPYSGEYFKYTFLALVCERGINAAIGAEGVFDGECKQVIEEYGPAIIDKVLAKLSPLQICTDLGLCANASRGLKCAAREPDLAPDPNPSPLTPTLTPNPNPSPQP